MGDILAGGKQTINVCPPSQLGVTAVLMLNVLTVKFSSPRKLFLT